MACAKMATGVQMTISLVVEKTWRKIWIESSSLNLVTEYSGPKIARRAVSAWTFQLGRFDADVLDVEVSAQRFQRDRFGAIADRQIALLGKYESSWL